MRFLLRLAPLPLAAVIGWQNKKRENRNEAPETNPHSSHFSSLNSSMRHAQSLQLDLNSGENQAKGQAPLATLLRKPR
jgi:hypothetical protein